MSSAEKKLLEARITRATRGDGTGKAGRQIFSGAQPVRMIGAAGTIQNFHNLME
jgi:hypothetical protein